MPKNYDIMKLVAPIAVKLLRDEAECCKVCLARSAKLAKSTEVPLVVTPEAASYARASKKQCLWTGPHVSTCKQNIHIANILLHLHT